MSQGRVERRLAAILAGDVAGYSRMMRVDEKATLAELRAVRSEIVEPTLADFGGRLVKTTGDGFLAEFASAVDAVQCASEIQRALITRAAEKPAERRIAMRIGINLGDVVVEDGDLFGDGVNVAARLEGLAAAGGVCVSGSVHEQVRGKLDLTFEDMGGQRVKNIDEPVRAYRVIDDTVPPAEELAPPDKPSIAVLPFDNLSADPEQTYFADGLAEDIISTLSKLAGLIVIARNSSFAYKGRAVDVRQVARELGVRYVLEGSVRRSGSRIRVNVQLIDALTGSHRWAQRFDRQIDDIFAVQDEITLNVATELQVQLTEGEQTRLGYTTTSNVQAWEYWIQGLAFVRSHVTRDGVGRAREFWEKALALDPSSAALNANLGMVHYGAARYHWWGDRKSELARAEVYAEAARNLDPDNGDAHVLMALIALIRGRHDDAMALAYRGIDLAPGSADIACFAALVFNYSGLPSEGLAQIERSFRLCPVYPAYYLDEIGLAHRLLGNHDEAIRYFREYSRRSPGFGHADLAIIYQGLGRHAEAQAEIARLTAARPGFTVASWRHLQFFRDAGQLEADMAALRAAGLPE